MHIVFFHQGYRRYLTYVLSQAKHASPDSPITLIGDAFPCAGVQFISPNDLQSELAETFTLRYIHMSSNPVEYEMLCWLRWFHLLVYMRKYNVKSVLHLDSDVLLYSSIESMRAIYADAMTSCGLVIPPQDDTTYQWCTSASTSFWTIDALESFCNFAIKSFTKEKYLQMYKDKWEYHLTKCKPGGICDMTGLYLYMLENRNVIHNLAAEQNGTVFDSGINANENSKMNEYLFYAGRKHVLFVDKHPCFVTSGVNRKLVRAHALHFAGNTKQHIPRYYTGRYFKGKLHYDLRYRCALLMQTLGM